MNTNVVIVRVKNLQNVNMLKSESSHNFLILILAALKVQIMRNDSMLRRNISRSVCRLRMNIYNVCSALNKYYIVFVYRGQRREPRAVVDKGGFNLIRNIRMSEITIYQINIDSETRTIGNNKREPSGITTNVPSTICIDLVSRK